MIYFQVSRYDSVEVYRTVVVLEDYLWKKGKAFHMWSRRYVTSRIRL
jgi:hypothetical protein